MSLSTEQRAALEQTAFESACEMKGRWNDSESNRFIEGFIEGAEWMEQNQWILVTERLPEDDREYQVTTVHGKIRQGKYRAAGKYWVDPGGGKLLVIAFTEMPAPYSPPKTENNAE